MVSLGRLYFHFPQLVPHSYVCISAQTSSVGLNSGVETKLFGGTLLQVGGVIHI